MRRGTTPTHTFTMPFSAESLQAVQIIYRQGGENILVLEKEDCTLSENTVSVRLSQEDTFAFNDADNVEIQIRVLTEDGDAMASDPMIVGCGRCLTEDVLI